MSDAIACSSFGCYEQLRFHAVECRFGCRKRLCYFSGFLAKNEPQIKSINQHVHLYWQSNMNIKMGLKKLYIADPIRVALVDLKEISFLLVLEVWWLMSTNTIIKFKNKGEKKQLLNSRARPLNQKMGTGSFIMFSLWFFFFFGRGGVTCEGVKDIWIYESVN